MSLRLKALNLALRYRAKPKLARMTEPAELREDLARFTRVALSTAPGAVAVPRPLGPHGALSIRTGAVGESVILHFHGGIFLAGSPETHLPMLSRLSRFAHAEVIAPRYPLAPEHPFPAALECAEAAWEALVEAGQPPDSIVLSGDSAGAGLAFALLSKLCARGTPPGAVLAFSPWLDLTGSGASLRDNAKADPLLPAQRLHEVAQFYLNGHPASDPEASPLFADFPGCPPVLILAAETEILLDDAMAMEEKLRKSGATVTLQLWPEVPHAWPFFAGLIPEASAALREAARFVQKTLSAPARS